MLFSVSSWVERVPDTGIEIQEMLQVAKRLQESSLAGYCLHHLNTLVTFQGGYLTSISLPHG